MKRRKSLVALLLAMIMVLLCGCGSGMSAEDAKAYTKSILDATYKGEFKDYIKWTDSTEEEAKKLYDSNMDTTLEQAGFAELGISDELLAKYKQLFMDMASNAKYEVGEVKEGDNDEYTVEVTVYPFTGFDGLQDEVTSQLDINSLADKSEQEMYEAIFTKMYEIMAQKLESPTYGDAQTFTVHVTPDDDGVYSISESELAEIDNAMFPSDGF